MILGIFLACITFQTNVRADSLRLRADFDYGLTESKTTFKSTGNTVKSETTLFGQEYDLDFSKILYPYLTFSGGLYYEIIDSSFVSEGADIDSRQTFARPFARMDWSSPMYQSGLEYRRSEIENDFTGAAGTRNLRDEFNASFGWQPVSFPELTLRYNQTHTYDDPETVDRLEKSFNLETLYTAYRDLQLYYSYQHTDDENRIRDSNSLLQSHNGRINYGRRFLEDRFALTAGYRVEYTKQELPTTGEVDNRITPDSGLSALDDTPEEGALTVNNALIDGNLAASAGIDLGLAGDETTLTNIGLDLGLPTDIDRILLWVDQRLTPTVAASFTWDVYTSPDNLDTSTWTLETTVSPATFGTFENRFEIRFPTLTARFIKIVTRPLSPLIPGALDFPNILVTEIEAFITLSGVEIQNEIEALDQDYNLSLSSRVGDKTTIGYDLLYRTRENEAFGLDEKRTDLSNGLFLLYTFDKRFSFNARTQRTDTSDEDEDTTAYTYSAALRAVYMPNFNQTLTYSGTLRDDQEGTSRSNSIFLRNNAILYRGWSAFLDIGFTASESPIETADDTTTFRLGTSVIPNAKLTLNLNYEIRFISTQNDDFTDSYGDIRVLYNPFRTLSLFGRLNVRDRESGITTLQNYSVNWSPFPGGTLQLAFAYDETLRSEDDRRERLLGPSLRWTVSRHVRLNATYNLLQGDSRTLKTESESFRAELNLLF